MPKRPKHNLLAKLKQTTFLIIKLLNISNLPEFNSKQFGLHSYGDGFSRCYGHTAFSVQRTAYSLQRTAYSLQRTAYSVQRTAYSVQRTAYSVQRTAYSVQRTAYSVQRTAYSAQRTAHSVQPTVLQPTVLRSYSLQCRGLLMVHLWRVVCA